MKNILSNKWIKRPLIAFFIAILVILLLPIPKFDDPYSTVIESNSGALLGAQIAKDGQWRFPPLDTIPDKFSKCLVRFEDNYFYYHLGFNPLAIGRALIQNFKSKRTISGASTISMQVVRLSRKGKGRNFSEKFIELFLATRLEIAYSKESIIKLYSTYAPFGGNVVGLEAASWRYYSCPASNLSWGEAATLAVLPNAPSLIYPGKNSPKLLAKRNRLLSRLKEDGTISEIDYELACLEPLPSKPPALPRLAPQLMNWVLRDSPQKKIQTTIDEQIQKRVINIIKHHNGTLSQNHINNACVLVLDIETGGVISYVGNTVAESDSTSTENDVDMIQANRSSGSILKPLLFSKMLDEGKILPNTLLKDIPVRFGGYSPQNYTLQFDGAVPASEALSRSLNIPALLMLKEYGIPEFKNYLQKLGISTVSQEPAYYGLSLILGGAEVKLWELSGVYSSMARTLKHYTKEHAYYSSDLRMPYYRLSDSSHIKHSKASKEKLTVGAGALWWTFEAMKSLKRPTGEIGWQNFSSSRTIAWKTGTSFGFRDAWAIGLNPKYLVGVWVGNANGEGRPGINGITAAAPILFNVFDILKEGPWFEKPLSDLYPVTVCHESGHRNSVYCTNVDTIYIPKEGLNTSTCPYHQLLHLDSSKKHQVNSQCYPTSMMVHQPWFILPPIMEWYYKQKHYKYRTMPPFLNNCETDRKEAIQVLYPEYTTQVFVPNEINGKKGYVIFKAAHHDPTATVYWHIDKTYIGESKGHHQMAVQPVPGKHLLTLIDNKGNVFKRYFSVVGKE